MTLKVIMAKLKIVSSLAYQCHYRQVDSYFIAIMENGAIFYRLPITAFIQRGFQSEEVPRRRLDELTAYGIVSVIILLFILGIS